MKIGYFPGCSLQGTARDFGESVRAVAEALGVELEEVRDWSCCGSTSAHATNHRLSLALPARTLALAEEQGLERVFAPCAACYSRLASAGRALRDDAKLRSEISGVIERPLTAQVGVLSILDWLRELAPDIERKRSVPLGELSVACYYGCLLVRPPGLGSTDDPEMPTSMETIVRAAGAKPVSWRMALECCGGGFSVSRIGTVVRLGRAILTDAKGAGASMMAVGCPMCHSNLDFRQHVIAERESGIGELPVLYLTQLVGLALGIEPRRLGLQRHFVSPRPILEQVAAALPAAREQA